MEVWDWIKVGAAIGFAVAIYFSVRWHRAAAAIDTLDRFTEAWNHLKRSRLALLLAVLFALMAIGAELDL